MEGNLTYRNSYGFDEMLLNRLKAISCDSKIFLKEVKKIMREKSSSKLWYSFTDKKVWVNGKYENTNFSCCPSSHAAKNYFCLVIEEAGGITTVKDGYLVSV